MRTKRTLVIAALLLASFTGVFAQAEVSPLAPIPILRNSDVLRMVNNGMKPGDVIAKILTSPCNFDIFPPVLQDLKRRGVPLAVLVTMKRVPSGPPAAPAGQAFRASAETKPVLIPAGTVVDVETAYPVSSATVDKGSPITFLVTRRVFVDGVLVIDRGAVARGHVIKSKRAGAWGRAGMLAWEMDYVVAFDGTQVPIQVAGHVKGGNRSAEVTGGAIATGALVFPYTSPVGLIWGLKKGDEAVLRGSRAFTAMVRADADVIGLPTKNGRVFYHNMDVVKASSKPLAVTQFERLSVRH